MLLKQVFLVLSLLLLRIDACRYSDYRTAFGNSAYTTVYDETAFVTMEGSIFVGFNFNDGSNNYQVVYMLNLKTCRVQWEKNLQLANARVVSLAVDKSKSILVALVKDADQPDELVYRFHIWAALDGSYQTGDLIDAYSTGLTNEAVLLQALMPSTTNSNSFFVLREGSLDQLDFDGGNFNRLKYSVSSKTLDAKHFDGNLFLARYDFDGDFIAFEQVAEDFSLQVTKYPFYPMFQAGIKPLSIYNTANARIAIKSDSSVFLFACVNVDDGGTSQDVVFSRIDWNTGDLLTLTVQNRWANCIVGASTDEDKASFLMKDQNLFYFAEVNFATSDVFWKKSNEWKIFAGGVSTFRAYGQYLMVDEQEDWFFVCLTNQIASAKFNYPVGIVVSTESDSRIHNFWHSQGGISPSSASDTILPDIPAHDVENLFYSASSSTIEALIEEHEDLAHNYWMRDTSCGIGEQSTTVDCTFWQILDHLPKNKTLRNDPGVPKNLKDCDFKPVFFPSDQGEIDEDALHAACFPKVISSPQKIPYDSSSDGYLVETDQKGDYFWFGADWSMKIYPKYFYLKYAGEYSDQFSKELTFDLTLVRDTNKVVNTGANWVHRYTSDYNVDKIRNFNVTCWSELCPEWVHVDSQLKLFAIQAIDTDKKINTAGYYAYQVTYEAQIDCSREIEDECSDFYYVCDWEDNLSYLEDVTEIVAVYAEDEKDFRKVYEEQCDALSGYPQYYEWRNEYEICSHDLLELCDTLQYPWIHKKSTLLIKVRYVHPKIDINKPYEIWYKIHQNDPKLHYYKATAPVLTPRKKTKKNDSSGDSSSDSSQSGDGGEYPVSWTDEMVQTAWKEAYDRSASSERPVTTSIDIGNTGLIKITFVPPINLPSYLIQKELVEEPTALEVTPQTDAATATTPSNSGRFLQDYGYTDYYGGYAYGGGDYYGENYYGENYYGENYYEDYYGENYYEDYYGENYYEDYYTDDYGADDGDLGDDTLDYYVDKCPDDNEYYDEYLEKCEPFRIYFGDISDMIKLSVIPNQAREDLKQAFVDTNFTMQFLSVNNSMIQIQATFAYPERVSVLDKFSVQMEKFNKFDRSFLVGTSKPEIVTKMTAQLSVQAVKIVAAAEAAGSAVLAVNAASLLLQLLMQGSLSQVWGMLHGLQFLIHLPTFGLEFPQSVHIVLAQIIPIATFDIPYVDMGNVTQSILFNAEGIDILTDFEDDHVRDVLWSSLDPLGYNSPFSSDCMGSAFIFTGIGLFLCAFACILFCWRKKLPRCLNNLYAKLVNIFFLGFFIRLFFEINIEMSYTSILNVRYGNWNTFPEGTEYGFGVYINYLVAVAWLAAFVGVPLFLTVFFWIPAFNYEKLQTPWWRKHFGSLVEELQLGRNTIAYLVLFTVRRTIFAFVVIDLAWCLWAQLFIHSVFTLVACCLILTYRVFEDSLNQKLEIFNEVIILSVVGVMFALDSTDGDQSEQLGYLYIGMLFFNLFIHFFYLFKGVLNHGIKFLLIRYQRRLLRKRGYRSTFIDRLIMMDCNLRRKKFKKTVGKTEESEPDFNSESVALKKKQYAVPVVIYEIEAEYETDKNSALRQSITEQLAKKKVDEEKKQVDEEEDLKNWQLELGGKVPNLFFDMTEEVDAAKVSFFTLPQVESLAFEFKEMISRDLDKQPQSKQIALQGGQHISVKTTENHSNFLDYLWQVKNKKTDANTKLENVKLINSISALTKQGNPAFHESTNKPTHNFVDYQNY